MCKKCFLKVKPYSQEIKVDLEKNYLDAALAAAYYEKPISTLIHELKYKNVKDVGLTCARMMHYLLKIPKADLITYVPLHKKRLQERGFNQSKVIAKELSRLTTIPCQSLLIRKKHSPPQAKINSREERLSRMNNVFAWKQNTNNNYKSVLLVDDVATTFTTLNECAKILKANGFEKVIALVVAHGD